MTGKQKLLVVLLVAVGLVTIISLKLPQQPLSAPFAHAGEDTSNDPCQTSSFGYLLALKEGNQIAPAYWKRGTQVRTLYDVRNIDLITHGPLKKSNGRPF